MSKIKWGALVVDGRGKLGGHVLTKTRSGATIRTKVTPVNPQTAAQAAARNRLGGNSQAWKVLTEEQRIGWNELASQTAKTNVFGDQYFPTGKNLYTALNSNLQLVGEVGIDTAPELVEIPVIVDMSISQGGEPFDLDINITLSGAATDVRVIVEATTMLSPGVFNPSGKFRMIQEGAASAFASPVSILASYEAKFGTLTNGKKVFVRAYAVSTITGQTSPRFVTSAILTGV